MIQILTKAWPHHQTLKHRFGTIKLTDTFFKIKAKTETTQHNRSFSDTVKRSVHVCFVCNGSKIGPHFEL